MPATKRMMKKGNGLHWQGTRAPLTLTLPVNGASGFMLLGILKLSLQ